MSGIVYKWRITDCKFAYLTDIYGGDPFITTQIQDDARISEVVKNLDEETYATKYETLCSIINADPDGRHIQMLDYKYYFNVDDTSCGLLQYAGTYYNGPQGEKGVGILRIQTIYEVGYTIIRFYLTDNTHYDAIIKNGISGVNGLNGDDGRDGETSNVILELESQRQDLENLREEILNAVTAEINERLKWSQDALIDFAGQLSALTNDSGYITYVQNELLGFEEKMWGYIDKSACTKTEFYTVIAPYSGFMETIAEYVNALTSAVTIYNNRIDIAEGQLKEAMSYYDAVAGQLNEYWLKYDAVNNRLESVVSEMTGNSSVTLSEIFQTARMVGLMVSGPSGSTDINGNPLMASIIAQINDTGSTISLSATKIYLLGETVASSLTSIDLTINGGNSYFGSDGSGWIANSGISWNAAGDMVIRGQLGIGDVIEGLSETDLEFAGGTNASTIFNRDGSGWLAGGNIYWDRFGTMTIKKDVRIEGVLSVDEIADGLGNSIISFGKDNSNAATVFYPDGAGSLAGGAISWDPDGSVKIAGDLTVGGSIKQEVLDYANETNLPVGGSTTEFRSDGSGYICNGAIEWDVNGNMKIDGSVTIGEIDDIDSAIEAYLNTKDLAINGGKSYFGSDGSGWLANHAIQWDSGGTLTIKGILDVTKGSIGGFTISETALINTAQSRGALASIKSSTSEATIGWDIVTDRGMLGALTTAKFYAHEGDSENIAIEARAYNGARNFALHGLGHISTQGASVGWGYAGFTPVSGNNTINLKYGNKIQLNGGGLDYCYLPTLGINDRNGFSGVRGQMGIPNDQIFGVELTITAATTIRVYGYNNGNAPDCPHIRDNDFDEETYIRMAIGDVLVLLLVWDGNSYNAWMVSHRS